MSKPKKIQIRNSTAEFLVFTTQAGEKGIEVRVEDQTVWLTQKLIGVLFEKRRITITEHLQNIFATGELDEKAVSRKFTEYCRRRQKLSHRLLQSRRHYRRRLPGQLLPRHPIPPVGHRHPARLRHSRVCSGQRPAGQNAHAFVTLFGN